MRFLARVLSAGQDRRTTKMQAVFNGVVIAESDDTIVVEGNHYFPTDSLRREFVTPSFTHTTCAWKGKASYMNVTTGDATSRDALWYYPTPSPAASAVKDRVAFWKGVKVRPAPTQDQSTPEPPAFDTPDGATC